MNGYTCVAALSCAFGFGALAFHELTAPLDQREPELIGIVRPREIPFSDHDHREPQQKQAPRYVSTITASGTSVSSLPPVFFVGSEAFTFQR